MRTGLLMVMMTAALLLVAACTTSVEVTAPGLGGGKAPEAAPAAPAPEQQPAAPGVTNDIGALLAAGTPSTCSFADDEGNQVTMWIKGEKYKSKTVNQIGTAWAIKDGSMLYSWLEGQSLGFKMDLSSVPAGDDAAPSGDKPAEGATSVSCRPASLSDSDFALPVLEFLSPSEAQGAAGG